MYTANACTVVFGGIGVLPVGCCSPNLVKRMQEAISGGKRVAEIVTIKIGPHRDLGFSEQDVYGKNRTVVGWESDWDPKDKSTREEVWHRSCCWWKLEPGRAVRCDLGIVLNPDNVVVYVAKIRGVLKRDDIMRMGFIGDDAGDEYEPWYGKILERNDSKNPIAYFDERAILPPGQVSADTIKLNR